MLDRPKGTRAIQSSIIALQFASNRRSEAPRQYNYKGLLTMHRNFAAN
jgi:hypothetical protein